MAMDKFKNLKNTRFPLAILGGLRLEKLDPQVPKSPFKA